ncbi:MAG: AAA family ATPase [Acidimicrobiales bacterium]
MEPRDYLRAVGRRWWVLVIAAVAAVVAVVVTTPSDAERARDRRFSADHTIALPPSGGLSAESNTARGEFLAASARLFRSPEVARRVSETLDRDDPESLASAVNVTVNRKRGTITFTATGRHGAEVARVVDTFAEAATNFQLELESTAYEEDVERTAARLESLRAQLNDVESQIGAARSDSSSLKATRDALASQLAVTIGHQASLADRGPPAPHFTTVSTARPVPVTDAAGDGFRPPESRRGRSALALVLALTLAVAVVLALDRFDMRLRTKAAAEHAFGLPVVAEVPLRGGRHSQSPEAATNPLSPVAEAYRAVRSAIMLARAVPRLGPAGMDPVEAGPNGTSAPRDRRHAYELRFEPLLGAGEAIKVIVVTSPGIGEGKSTTVANLAASFAEADRSVLVVDCHLRRPTLDRLLGVDAQFGLSDVLVSRDTRYRLTDIARTTSVPGVRLVPSGTPMSNPAALLTGAREMLLRCRDSADVVIVDTPAALSMNDAAELMPAADAVVVVARAGTTTSEAAHRMTALLGRLGVRVFGVALIGVGRGAKVQQLSTRRRRRSGRKKRPVVPVAVTLPPPSDTSPPAAAAHGERPTALVGAEAASHAAPPPARGARSRRLRPFRRVR